MGLLSLAATVRANHQVAFLDACVEGYDNEEEVAPNVFRFGLSVSEIRAKIEAYSPDVVAISNSFTSYWRQALEVAEIAKNVSGDIVTIMGGQHATGAAKETLSLDSDNAIDYIILKEGEATFGALLKSIQNKIVPEINGVVYRCDGNVVGNDIEYRRIDLKTIPYPAFDLLKPYLYKSQMSHFGKPRGANFIDIMFSRGCPIGCSYCTTGSHFGKLTRQCKEDDVREILRIIGSQEWKEIVVEDDNFAALPFSFQESVAKKLSECGLHWNLDGGLYYPYINRRLVEMLANNGCYRVFLPVESPDLALMQSNHKYLELDAVVDYYEYLESICKLLSTYNIEFYVAVMLGFPGQMKRDIQKACDLAEKFVRDFGAIGVSLHWVHPYPGTEFYRRYYSECSQKRKWQLSPEYYSFVKPVFPLSDMSLEEMEEIAMNTLHQANKTNVVNASEFIGASCYQ